MQHLSHNTKAFVLLFSNQRHKYNEYIRNLTAFERSFPAEKNNKQHNKISNGFTGYNGICIVFNGNCNGPCGSLLVIGCLLLVAC